MAEPLVIQFAADTSRAQSALATLAAQVVGNMTQIGVAMAGGAANANGFGAALEGMKANAIRAAASVSADVRAIAGATGAAVTAEGATLQSVAFAFTTAAVTSNTASASARAGVAATATALGTVTAQLPALGQLAVGLGVAGGAYLTSLAGLDPLPAHFAANGGPVSAGQPVTVGEMGREVFVPQQNGTILPLAKGAGWGGGAESIALSVDVSGARGNQEIMSMVHAGVAAGMAQTESRIGRNINGIVATGRRRYARA